jgi:hypothetical protein
MNCIGPMALPPTASPSGAPRSPSGIASPRVPSSRMPADERRHGVAVIVDPRAVDRAVPRLHVGVVACELDT